MRQRCTRKRDLRRTLDFRRVYEAPFLERAGRLPLGQASKREEAGITATFHGPQSLRGTPTTSCLQAWLNSSAGGNANAAIPLPAVNTCAGRGAPPAQWTPFGIIEVAAWYSLTRPLCKVGTIIRPVCTPLHIDT